MIIILFGIAGAGKNFVGEYLARENNFFFWDADEALTPTMRQAIQQKHLFTQRMRDEFCSIVVQRVQRLLQQYHNVVLAQGFYKESNRVMLAHYFPEAHFIHVTANNEVIAQRLRDRADAVDNEYAQLIRSQFEMPTLQHHVLINNEPGVNAIQQQLKDLHLI